jgi:hypothetical protein
MAGAGLSAGPRALLDAIGRLKCMDAVLATERGRQVQLRCVSRPEEDLADLLHCLGIAPPGRLLPRADCRPPGCQITQCGHAKDS